MSIKEIFASNVSKGLVSYPCYYTHIAFLEFPPNNNQSAKKMAMDDLSGHVSFPLFTGLGFILLSTTLSACLFTGLGYKWFLNESPAKYQLCEAPDVQFCFFETLAQRSRFNSAIITGAVVLYVAACKYRGSDTFCVFFFVLFSLCAPAKGVEMKQ